MRLVKGQSVKTGVVEITNILVRLKKVVKLISEATESKLTISDGTGNRKAK